MHKNKGQFEINVVDFGLCKCNLVTSIKALTLTLTQSTYYRFDGTV